jgi:hypothetical protein
MRSADQLHAALRNRAGCRGFLFATDLVDDDDLRHVVLDGLDHDLMLQFRRGHLHAPRAADGRVRDVAVAADFVGGIHDDNACLLAQDPGGLAQQGRLANARPAQQQDALARLDDILDDIDHAVHRAADTAGQTDDACPAGCGCTRCGGACARCRRGCRR